MIKKGFSLLEILLSIALIGILIAIVAKAADRIQAARDDAH